MAILRTARSRRARSSDHVRRRCAGSPAVDAGIQRLARRVLPASRRLASGKSGPRVARFGESAGQSAHRSMLSVQSERHARAAQRLSHRARRRAAEAPGFLPRRGTFAWRATACPTPTSTSTFARPRPRSSTHRARAGWVTTNWQSSIRSCVCTVSSGLRVVDASVMPEIISCNIHAVVLAIAEWASDVIRGRAACPRKPRTPCCRAGLTLVQILSRLLVAFVPSPSDEDNLMSNPRI